MVLNRNSHLGPYEILGPLGSGGMGEVYRARDTRLDREVAIKIVRDDVSAGPDRLSRFEREARAVAALNHPNILSIFDLGEEQGSPYAVTELIHGEPLRSLIRQGPVPIRTLIDIAAQIADGLSCAHAANIAHRDLKPENIMVTDDGRVKILDFGLARHTGSLTKPGAGGVSTVTVTQHMTQPGTILGTANYMSPEQARGLETDYRGDQFAFGLILYELASGKQAFSRDSTVETLAAIVREEPPPLEAKLPPPLRWAMERCLAKDPAQRYESTRDLYRDLRALRDHFSEAYTSAAIEPLPAEPPKRRQFWQWVAIPACILTAVAIGIFAVQDVGVDLSRNRHTPFAVGSDPQTQPLWSPDGKAIAWMGIAGGHSQLFVRYLNSPVATQLTHLDYAEIVRWSPDSKRIVFVSTGPNSTKGKPFRSLYSISLIGGEPEHLGAMPVGDFAIAAADVSPDLGTVAIFGSRGKEKKTVFLASPIGSAFREYQPAPFASATFFNRPKIRFSPDGSKLLLVRTADSNPEEAWILAIPSKQSPRRVLTHLPASRVTDEASWMSDNRHVAIAINGPGGDPRSHIWIADTESGDAYQVTGGTGTQPHVDISRDGKRIVYTESQNDLDVVSLSLADGKPTKLIATSVRERMPAWSANATKLAYVTNRNGPQEIWIRTGDGEGRPLVTQQSFPGSTTRIYMNPALSPGGERIVFSRMGPEGAMHTWIMPLATGTPVRLNDSVDRVEFAGAWSPDGARFAEILITNAGRELAVLKVGSRAAPVTLRRNVEGYLPAWSPTGEWISFRDESGWNLISPDGKAARPLGEIETPYLTFSKDGKVLYGIRQDADRWELFSLNIATLKSTHIQDLDKDLAPASDYNPGIRFSLTPDGKSITYSAGTRKSDLWVLEGFRRPGILGRLGLNRP